MDKNHNWGERKETIPFLSDICPSLVRDLFGKTVNRMSEQYIQVGTRAYDSQSTRLSYRGKRWKQQYYLFTL